MKSYRPNGDSIDHSMLDKLNRPARRSGLSASVSDLSGTRPHRTQLTTLSLPHRTRQPFLDSSFTKSPGAMSTTSATSATSPINAPFGHHPRGSMDYRSPLGTEGSDLDRSPLPHPHDGARAGYRGAYDARDDEIDFPMEETSRLRSLAIEDQWRERDWDRDRERERERDCYQPGQKRRASSPPSDDAALAGDVLRRRDGGLISRGSPTPRLLVIPQNSLSSVSSASRSGSYASNLTASSITSMGSLGRRSPNGLSPAGLSPTDPMSPYPPPSLSGSPRPSLGRSTTASSPHHHHHRTPSEQPLSAQVTRTVASPRKLAEIPKSHSSLAAKLKSAYMCECCPKKPKKFETEEDLRYGCSTRFVPLRLPFLTRGRTLQGTRGRETVRMLLLRESVQEQERGGKAPKLAPRPAPQLVLLGVDGIRAGIP